MREALIFDAIRTPRGKALETGALHNFTPFELLSTLYRALEQRNQLNPKDVDDIILGCVTQYGEQAANIAKTSSLYAEWPHNIPGITVNRYCSSGLDAINMGALKVASAMDELVIAGGVEMMSRVPMLSDRAAVFTDANLATKTHMFMMGCGADLIASLYDVDKRLADTVALGSQQKAQHASESGYFSSIIPIKNPDQNSWISKDECIRPQTTLEKLSTLKPSFVQPGAMGTDAEYLKAFPKLRKINHVHSAGNSPTMADGAATVLIGTKKVAHKLAKQPRARIAAMTNSNDDVRLVLGGCVSATAKLLHQENLTQADIDLFEIHEAFAATMIKCQQDLGIPDEKLNVNGGCIALGHPLGATGAMMLGTLLDELERRDLTRGVVATSGAAGAGTALMIERI